MASEYDMRVGDTEREGAAAELREHYASGRLTLGELNERIDKAFAAKTRGDLNALMTDLPSARPRGAGARPSGFGGPPGPHGPIGTNGPLGPHGPFGAQGPFGSGGSGGGSRAGGAARTVTGFLTAMVVMGALFAVGMLGVFGIGAGRPFGVVLILAALALLRRLFFRRRRVRAGGPRGRRRW